jgi:enolase-phosphatase E1
MTTRVQHILLDIEGTTCPVSFVSSVLFPYAANQVNKYLERHSREEDVQLLLLELLDAWSDEEAPEARELLQRSTQAIQEAEAARQDEGSSRCSLSPTVLLPYINWLIRSDRKLTAWKDLQGRIWQQGYAKGDLKAALFPDVARCLRNWNLSGLQLSVYSSGSVPAQHLLYAHSTDGDLRGLFSHWFDTRIGAKQDKDSYVAILAVLGHQPEQVLFISDAVRELQAAAAAGMQVVFSDRDGNPERDPAGHRSIRSFEELDEELTGL